MNIVRICLSFVCVSLLVFHDLIGCPPSHFQNQINEGLNQLEQEFVEVLKIKVIPKLSIQEITNDPNKQITKYFVKLKLEQMVKKDQYVRKEIVSYMKENHIQDVKNVPTFLLEIQKRTDNENTKYLKKLLSIYQWFDISEFDKETDHNAWLLVQHADHDSEFQKRVLEILADKSQVGETSPTNYAYLFDRTYVDMFGERKQKYGTQAKYSDKEGQFLTYPPLVDENKVDQFRQEIGMEPLEKYLEHLNKVYSS